MRKFLIMLIALVGMSVCNAQVDSIYKNPEQIEEYKSTHHWNILPTKDMIFVCHDCGDDFQGDSLVCLAILNDTVYSPGRKNETFPFGLKTHCIHRYLPIFSSNLFNSKNKSNNINDKYNTDYIKHINIYSDELLTDTNYYGRDIIEKYLSPHDIKGVNLAKTYLKYDKYDKDYIELFALTIGIINADWVLCVYDIIEEECPYGYFEDWSWTRNYSNLNFDFAYRNTNKKTIKYIKVYWEAFNDVGDKRNSGYFDCTGPVEYWSRGRWKIDNSRYYLIRDVTKLKISKVIITYMDNTHITLIKHIKYEN